MMQSIHKKVRIYLETADVCVVIMDLLSNEKIGAILSKTGIEFPGKRLSNIPRDDLIMALAEESYIHPDVMDELVKVLNKNNQDEIEKIKGMSVGDVKEYLEDIGDICYSKKIGNVLWALLCDEREEVNTFIKGFLRQFLKIQKRSGKKPGLRISKEKATEIISNAEKEIKGILRESDALKEKNRRFAGEIGHLQSRIQELQRLNGRLSNEKGILRKEKEKALRRIEAMGREISILKEKIHTAPKVQLVSQLRSVEKENKKLIYELEKERNETRNDMERYKKENAELRERLNELQIMTYKLEEELDIEKQHVIDTEQAKKGQSAVTDAGNITLPHKGRRLGVFVDGHNIYYSAKVNYGRKMDYRGLLFNLTRDRHLVKAVYYIIEPPGVELGIFINMLKNTGYTVRSRGLIRRLDGSVKADWNVGMAVDVINAVEKNNLDIVALVTCDGDFYDLVKLLKQKDVRVEIAGFPNNTAMDLKDGASEFYPLGEELMLPVPQEVKADYK